MDFQSFTQNTQTFPQSVIKWFVFFFAFFFFNHLCVHGSSFKKLFLRLHNLTNSLTFILFQFSMPSSLGLIISSFYLRWERCVHFTWKLRGHCRISNWPNFNIIVSQGVRRPEEGERDWGTASWYSSWNSHIIYVLSSLSYMGAVHGTTKQLQS